MNNLECSITELTIEDSKAYDTNAKVFNQDLDKHAVKDYYSKWAEEYDDHLAPGRYNGPSIAAEACASCFADAERENAVVLDVAAGTGRVGIELLQRGFCNIHALDPSEGMLEIAKSKNIYRKFLCEFLTADKLPVNEGTYDCVTSSGGMGDGHIPSEALHEMVRITKPGGYIVTVMREEYLDGPEYKDKLENLMHKLEKQGKWKRIERSVVPNYAFNKTGVIFRYKVL